MIVLMMVVSLVVLVVVVAVMGLVVVVVNSSSVGVRYEPERGGQDKKIRSWEMQKQLFRLLFQNLYFLSLLFFSLFNPFILGITDTCFHLGVLFTSDLLIVSRTFYKI